MKLLICDDDISTVDVIQNQLSCAELGISGILRAYNGAAAKDLIARERPELILCDIGMPICDGIEVLKYVYENKIQTEFAFLTCHEDFEYAKTALLYGACDYITKPFEMEELKISLQRMIASAAQKRSSFLASRQAQFDSVLTSVLRQISDGMYGTDRGSINSLLQRNGLRFRAEDGWHLVVSCADMTDAARAGLLHDVTKALDGPLQLTICAEYGTILDDFSAENPKTLHALTGSFVARDVFGENEAVVNAIRSHTTGKGGMNTLEKIIYVADYMEPNRDFPGVEELRRLAYTDLDGALKLGLEMTLEHLKQQGAEVSPATRDALEYLKLTV